MRNRHPFSKFCGFENLNSIKHFLKLDSALVGTSRDGLVGYDAALTQLRSRVRFPVFVFFARSAKLAVQVGIESFEFFALSQQQIKNPSFALSLSSSIVGNDFLHRGTLSVALDLS